MPWPRLEDIKINVNWIKKHHIEFYNYINSDFKGKTFSEKLYRYYHPKEGKCKICGKECKFINFTKGFHMYCSCKCRAIDKDWKKNVKNTCLEKYGVTNVSKVNEVKQKRTQSILKKYGVEHALQNDKLKNKAKRTTLKKYGVENYSQTEECKQKVKQTVNNLYGGYTLQIPEKKSYILKLTEKKYGGIGYASPILNEKVKNTCTQKYGNPNYSNRGQYKKTMLKRYGVLYPSLNKEICNKISQSNKSLQIKKIDDLIGYTEDGKWICKCPHSDICNQCDEKFYIIKCQMYHNRKSHNCELCTKLFPIGSKEGGISNASKQYFNQLKEYFPDLITEHPLGKYKLDCYIPSLQIDIEYNGVYWHAKPTIYNSTDILNFYGVYKTAQQIWDHDKERENYIKKQGIKVVVVWEDNLPNPRNLYKSIIFL